MPVGTLVDVNDLLRRSRQFLRDPPCREPPSGRSVGDAPVRGSTRDHSGTELGSPSPGPSGSSSGASHGQCRACGSIGRSPRGAAGRVKGWESFVSFFSRHLLGGDGRRSAPCLPCGPVFRKFPAWGAQSTPEILLRSPSGVRNGASPQGFPCGRPGTVRAAFPRDCDVGWGRFFLHGVACQVPTEIFFGSSPGLPPGVRGHLRESAALGAFMGAFGSSRAPPGVRSHLRESAVAQWESEPQGESALCPSGRSARSPAGTLRRRRIQQAREPIRCSSLLVATPGGCWRHREGAGSQRSEDERLRRSEPPTPVGPLCTSRGRSSDPM